MAAPNFKSMVDKQVSRVLREGQRFTRFDQVRQRHFWSSYFLQNGGAGSVIAAGPYELFKVVPGGVGQGYPAAVPLTLKETNWRNGSRVPDNQNFVITEIGVSLQRPAPVDMATSGAPANAPANGIYANLSGAVQALINPHLPINPTDAARILYGATLNMQYLTNSIPIGWLGDFSQSSGRYTQNARVRTLDASWGSNAVDIIDDAIYQNGDPVNGFAAPAFRRKLDIPILLQHGETASMSINVPRAITTQSLAQGGCGWMEIRVDWWAIESFVEKS